ncbi:MAG TPA: hypothetical protein VHC86_05470 [Opitutaceae bacterium]|nr:hypothetical protein [Opitutaceae bacterium]
MLDEPALLQVHGAADAVTIACDAAGAYAGALAGGPLGAALGVAGGEIAADIFNNLATINAALGPPGSFDPYANPIACEYGCY